MTRRRLFQFLLFWTVLVVLALNRMPLAGQTASTLTPKNAQKDYAPTRPTRFNITAVGGTGLVQAVSPYTLAQGDAAFGASVMNFDRDPGDTDLFEYTFQGSVGLPKRIELFVRVMPWFRTNSANLDPLRFPVPPLDLFVDTYPTLAIRSGPKFLFTPTLPYKTYNPVYSTETGAFSSSSGNNLIGAKKNLRSEDRGDAFGLGVRAFIEIPSERPHYNAPYPEYFHQAGVSGKINYGGDVLISRTWKAVEFTGNIGYKQTGNPERGLRIQMVDSSQTAPDKFRVGDPINIPLKLSNELRISTGWTVPMFHYYKSYWWFVAEINHTHYVGGHTLTERLVHPTEVSAGVQSNFPWYKAVSVGAQWQLLLNDGGKGKYRTTAFQTADGRGDINFSELLDNPQLTTAVEDYLKSHGVDFSQASSKVLSTNNPALDAWRNIPVMSSRIQSQGHTNIVAFATWRFGGRF